MNIQKEITEKMKSAMKAKDSVSLTALRALKSAFLTAKTMAGAGELTHDQELKIIQKQVKQRKDSAQVYIEQNREDLAQTELSEAKVLEQFLPEALSEEEIEKIVSEIISEINAEGMKDMGKVMGIASQKLSGQADGKTISTIVKKQLM